MKTETSELDLNDQRREPTVANMLQALVQGGVTADNVVALEKMTALYERMQDREAELQFNRDFATLMGEIPQVNASKAVPNRDGTVRYRFAPLEEIDAQLRPLAIKHGFTYTFAEGEVEGDKLAKVCTVYHKGGHKRSNSFSVRKSAPPGSTDTQADGSTHSYAKRGALCDAFGIIVAHMDDDARLVGSVVSSERADSLKERVLACGANEEAFLRFAGAADYASIPENRYDALDGLLKRKEQASRKEPIPTPSVEPRNAEGEIIW